jgi:hypothetical protein
VVVPLARMAVAGPLLGTRVSRALAASCGVGVGCGGHPARLGDGHGVAWR